MQFIKATPQDMPEIMAIINDAKEMLKEKGIDQWQKGYPNEAVMLQDITNEDLYFAQIDEKSVAILALIFEADPNYSHIEEGNWLTDLPYSVIHRVAVGKENLGKGIMGRIIAYAEELTLEKALQSMRIDTHPENKSMQRALTKAGYQYCGHVFMSNGDLRYAYEKPLVKSTVSIGKEA